MKAIIIRQFGSPEVLEFVADCPRPALQTNQVLVKVQAAGVNPLDCKIREGKLRLLQGAQFPIIPGNDASGIVVETGSAVKNVKAGDEVYGFFDANPNPSLNGFAKSGTYAELAVTRDDTLAIKPKSMTHREAASVPLAALTAYQILRIADIKAGDKILINGASGGVGIFAVQIAKLLGGFVTAVCSERNRELVTRLGADRIVNYREQSLTALPETFDVIYDVVAATSFAACRHILSRNGIFISNANLTNPLNMFTTWLFPLLQVFGVTKRTDYAWVKPSGTDLTAIARLIEEGRLRTHIDRVYAMKDIREAHAYSESGRVQGKLVVDINTA